eukprot:Nk52_evm2s2438 gene=Nk52_evmTU2s2438
MGGFVEFKETGKKAKEGGAVKRKWEEQGVGAREWRRKGGRGSNGGGGFVKDKEKQLKEKAMRLRRSARQLPIAEGREAILSAIRAHGTVVLVGETGSGKTTQLTQYLYEEQLKEEREEGKTNHNHNKKKTKGIVCTQPRRVAAVTVAKRVGEEVGCRVGEEVGYTIRFDDMTNRKKGTRTVIKYVTDGMLLREAMIMDKAKEGKEEKGSDGDLCSLLEQYSVIILDEAHERTLHTDVLFGVIKKIQRQRRDLRVVIMSATLEAQKFSDFFDMAPILYISGRQFPVEVMYTRRPESDYIDAAMTAAIQIHETSPPVGDILVFLTGQEEIEAVQKLLLQYVRERTAEREKKQLEEMRENEDMQKDATSKAEERVVVEEEERHPELMVCPIFAALPSSEQMKVFEPTPSGFRKVILATNIAETSITINGIKYVVDPGLVKSRGYNPRIGLDTLTVAPISKAQAQQRAGRAGREQAGACYRLYTEEEFDKMEPETKPEILRSNMSTVVLQLKAMGIDDILNFDFLDRPNEESLVQALELLYCLGALDDRGKLSTTGKKMAEFPLEPRLAKTILAAVGFECVEEILTIVSMLSVDSVFYAPNDKREKANFSKRKFASYEGDHITLLNVFKAYKEAGESKKWCIENFINARTMKSVLDVRQQLVDLCGRMKIELSSCGMDTVPIRKTLVAGFFVNVATLQPDNKYRTMTSSSPVSIHPGSVLFGKKPQCLLFNELVFTSKQYMREVSQVEPEWLTEVAPKYFA